MLRWSSVRLRGKFVAGTPNLNYPFILKFQCFSVLGYRQHIAVETVPRTGPDAVTY
jgi:hydroxypyruvate isomerase